MSSHRMTWCGQVGRTVARRVPAAVSFGAFDHVYVVRSTWASRRRLAQRVITLQSAVPPVPPGQPLADLPHVTQVTQLGRDPIR